MTLQEIAELIHKNLGYIIIALMSVVEISKIKINPWTALFKWVGNLLMSGVKNDIKRIDAELKAVVETIAETEPPTEAQQDSEAVALARLADSVARGRSDEVKRIVMWVAINRSEDRSHGYGLSLLEEIARPKQWQEYSPDANYLESTLRLAEEVLEVRDSGGARPIYGDMLWFVLNNDGSITVRNQFQVSKNRSEATFGQ